MQEVKTNHVPTTLMNPNLEEALDEMQISVPVVPYNSLTESFLPVKEDPPKSNSGLEEEIDSGTAAGRWTKEEHKKFLEGTYFLFFSNQTLWKTLEEGRELYRNTF